MQCGNILLNSILFRKVSPLMNCIFTLFQIKLYSVVQEMSTRYGYNLRKWTGQRKIFTHIFDIWRRFLYISRHGCRQI